MNLIAILEQLTAAVSDPLTQAFFNFFMALSTLAPLSVFINGLLSWIF